VKTYLTKATLVAVTGLMFTWAAAVPSQLIAQDKGGRPAANKVAVIDLPYIVKNWDWLKVQKEKMQGDAKVESENFKGQQEKLQKQMEKMQALSPSSAEYKDLERKITQSKSDLQVNMALKDKEFKERDVQIMYDAIKKIDEVVQEFCQTEGIGLVIQYTANQMDAAKPGTIQDRLASPVFYQDGKDISEVIIQRLKTNVAGRQGAGRTK
jgi:Skp family chaperone for outer membrane proteins